MRERVKNDLGTPEWLLEFVRRVGPIALDPCSNPWSLVGARVNLSLENGDDGLAADWRAITTRARGLVYCNPPYGHADAEPDTDRKHGPPLLPRWTKKIRDEAARGVEIISLVPHDISTEWWRTMRKSCSARIDLDKRIAFEGGKFGAGQIKNAVFYHGPRPYLFAHAFADLGEVHLYAHRRAA